MQNQFVFSAGKSFVGHYFSGALVKNLGLQQQRSVLPHVKNDLQSRNFSDNRDGSCSVPLLLPGGGLGKLQGSFKEEQYFNLHEHLMFAQLQKADYRLKCERVKVSTNWKEFERMANDFSQLTAFRQSGQLCKYKNFTEESFFFQEQRSLLERIIDALRSLFSNRGGGMPYPPPYGGGYYPNSPQYYQKNEEKNSEESERHTQSNEEENSEDGGKTNEESPKLENEMDENDENAQESQDFEAPYDGRGDQTSGEDREK